MTDVAVADSDQMKRGLRSTVGKLATLQQRFEESRVGKVVISVVILAFVLVGVVFNLPDSPIRRSLLPVAEPIAKPTGLDPSWAMYANLSRRRDTVEVHVQMADAEKRVWTMQPGERGVGWWDRWILLRYAAVLDANLRPQLARWVAREITEPSERAVTVTMILRTETLTAPGESEGEAGRRPTAMKLLYQENLAAPQ
jgi:hypothetical protein